MDRIGNGVEETAMIPNSVGYVFLILSQFLFIVGLVWYVMHLLDRERRDRYRFNSIKLLSNVSASCDLAALAERVSRFSAEQLEPAARPTRGRFGQGTDR